MTYRLETELASYCPSRRRGQYGASEGTICHIARKASQCFNYYPIKLLSMFLKFPKAKV